MMFSCVGLLQGRHKVEFSESLALGRDYNRAKAYQNVESIATQLLKYLTIKIKISSKMRT